MYMYCSSDTIVFQTGRIQLFLAKDTRVLCGDFCCLLEPLLMQASNTEFVGQFKPGSTNQQWSELAGCFSFGNGHVGLYLTITLHM